MSTKSETMKLYLICYRLPVEELFERQLLNSKRSNILKAILKESSPYSSLYKVLEKLKAKWIMTSSSLVVFEGGATDLVAYILRNIDRKIRADINLFVTELSDNRAKYPKK